jgi:hypothetical protein
MDVFQSGTYLSIRSGLLGLNTAAHADHSRRVTRSPRLLAFSVYASNLPGPVLGLDVRVQSGLLALGVAKQQKVLIWDPVTKTTVGTIPTPGSKPTQSLAWTFPCQQQM